MGLSTLFPDGSDHRAASFKVFPAYVDYRSVTSAVDSLHHFRASQGDLFALARYWKWEQTVEAELPRVIAEDEIHVLFQPIYRISHGLPIARGFEALARFPAAPRIPVGLWFRLARDSGLGADLEMAAARAALRALGRVSAEAFLCVNASLDIIPDLAAIIPETVRGRLVIDLPYASLRDERSRDLIHALREEEAWVAIDDVPLDDLHLVRPSLAELRPDFVKVDVLTGLADNPMARFNLAEGSAWCQEAGIELIAERVERVTDLSVLDGVGVEWAQGYSLSRPVEL